MMVSDIETDRSFFIDHRIGTNTRGQVFETIRGERRILKSEDIPYVAQLFERAADKLLSEPTEEQFRIRRKYYAMQHEILLEALVKLKV
jgi:hypothetical protein